MHHPKVQSTLMEWRRGGKIKEGRARGDTVCGSMYMCVYVCKCAYVYSLADCVQAEQFAALINVRCAYICEKEQFVRKSVQTWRNHILLADKQTDTHKEASSTS